jgi:MFS family permease
VLPRRLLVGPAGRALTVLTAVNLLNYLDRFLVPALVESLRSDLALRDAQVGALTTAFILVYMVASPAFGALGDRRARPPLLALGVALWSGATALSALARGFVGLVVARAAVGIGEAAYGTLTPGLLADHYEESRRGRAYAVFFMAIPVGAALGYVVGGLVDRLAGWRAAFLVAGVPGFFLALACLRLADPPRGAHDHGAAPAGTLRDTYRRLFRNGPYALTVLGYAAYTFAVGGLAAWMPAFLERVRGVPRARATAGFGLVVVATGLAGTLAGGAIADALRRRWRAADLWVSGIATLAAVPFAVAALVWTTPAAVFAVLVLAQLLLFASTGPVNAAIVAQVEPRDRASAVALSILAIHALGDVPSPTLVGWLSDRSSLGEAVKVLPAAVLVAGVVWTWAARREERRARTAQTGSIR